MNNALIGAIALKTTDRFETDVDMHCRVCHMQLLVFSTDIMQPRLLGAIGRVYTTTEPEICGDVQKYDKQIYLRVTEAERCRVHSTVVIPFFDPTEKHRALGVIEVVKNDKGASFAELLDSVISSLENVNLCTSDIDLNQIEEGLKQWPAASDLHSFELGLELGTNQGVASSLDMLTRDEPTLSQPYHHMELPGGSEKLSFFDMCTKDTEDIVNAPHAFVGAEAVGLQRSGLFASTQPHLGQSLAMLKQMSFAEHTTEAGNMFQHPISAPLVDLSERDVPGLIGMAQMNMGSMFRTMPPTDMAGESEQLDREKLEELLHTLTSNKFRKKRRQKMGSGKHLTYQDLQKHFGMGLKQAAAKLGICPTTLKRACRRNGIERWPSRSTHQRSTQSTGKPFACTTEGYDGDVASPEAMPTSLSQPSIMDTPNSYPPRCQLDTSIATTSSALDKPLS